MENTEFTKQLAENPLIKGLIDLSIKNQTAVHLMMAFLAQKMKASKEDQIKLVTEFREFFDKNQKEDSELLMTEFMKNYFDR